MKRLLTALISLALMLPSAPVPRIFPFDDEGTTTTSATEIQPLVIADGEDDSDEEDSEEVATQPDDDVEDEEVTDEDATEVDDEEAEEEDEDENEDDEEEAEEVTELELAGIVAKFAASGGTIFLINDAQFAPDTNPGDGVCSTGATSYDGVTPACNMRAALMETNALGAIVAAGGALPTDGASNPIAPPYTITVDQTWLAGVTNSASNINYPTSSSSTGANTCTSIANPTPALFGVTQNGATSYNYFDLDNGWQTGTVANNVTVTLPNFSVCGSNFATSNATASTVANLMYPNSLGDTAGAYFYVTAPVTINLNYQLSWNSGTGTQTQNHPDIFYINADGVVLSGLKNTYAQISTITIGPNTSNLVVTNVDTQPSAALTTRFLTINGGAGSNGPLQVINSNIGGFRGQSATSFQNGGAVVFRNSGINGNATIGDLTISNCSFNGVLPFNANNGATTATAGQHVGNVSFANNIITNLGAQTNSAVMRFDATTVDGTINATDNVFRVSNIANAVKFFNFDNGVISPGATVNLAKNQYLGCSGTCTGPSATAPQMFMSNAASSAGTITVTGNFGNLSDGSMDFTNAPSSFVSAPAMPNGGTLTVTNNMVSALNNAGRFVSGNGVAGSATAPANLTISGNTYTQSGTLSTTGNTPAFYYGFTAISGALILDNNIHSSTGSTTTTIVSFANLTGLTTPPQTLQVTNNTFTSTTTTTGSITGGSLLLNPNQVTVPILVAGNTVNTNGIVVALTASTAATGLITVNGNTVNASAAFVQVKGPIQAGVIIQGNPKIVVGGGTGGNWVAQLNNSNNTGPITIANNPSITATTTGNANNSTLITLTGTVPAGSPGYTITNNSFINTYNGTTTGLGYGSVIVVASSLAAGSTVTISHNSINSTGAGGAVIVQGNQLDPTATTIIDSNVITSAGSLITLGTSAINIPGTITVSNNNFTLTGTTNNHRFHFSAGVTADTTNFSFVNNYTVNTSDPMLHAVVVLPFNSSSSAPGTLKGVTNIKFNTFKNLNGTANNNSGHWVLFPTALNISPGTTSATYGNNGGTIAGQLQITNNYVQYKGTTVSALAWTGPGNSIVNSNNLYIQNNYFDWSSTSAYGTLQFNTTGLKNVSGNIYNNNVINLFDTVDEEKRSSTGKYGLFLHAAAANGAMATWYPSARSASPTASAANQTPMPLGTVSGSAAAPTDIVAVPTPAGAPPGTYASGPTPGNAAITGPTPATPATVQTNPLEQGACVVELAVAAPTAWTNARYPGNTSSAVTSVPANNPVYVDVYWTSGTLGTTTGGTGAGAANDAELFIGRYPVYGTAQTLAVVLPQAGDPRLSPVFGAGALQDEGFCSVDPETNTNQALCTSAEVGGTWAPIVVPQSQMVAAGDPLVGTMLPVDGSTINVGTILPIGQITPVPNGQTAPTTGPIDPVTNQISGALRLQTLDPTAPILATSQYSRSVQIGGNCSPQFSLAQASGDYTWDQIGSTDPAQAGQPVTQLDPTMGRDLHFTVSATMPVPATTITPASLDLTVTAPAAGLKLPSPLVDWTDPSQLAAHARIVQITPLANGLYFDVTVRLDDTGTATLSLTDTNLSMASITPAPDNAVTYVNPLQISQFTSAAQKQVNGVPSTVPNQVLITGSPDGQQYNLYLNTHVNGITPPTPTATVTSVSIITGKDPANGSTPALTPATPTATIDAGSTTGAPVVVTANGVATPVTPGTALTLTQTVNSTDANYNGLVLPTLPITLYTTTPQIGLTIHTYKLPKPYSTIAEVLACVADTNCGGVEIFASDPNNPAVASVYDWVCAVATVENTSPDPWVSSVNQVKVTPVQPTWPPVPNNPFPDPTAQPLPVNQTTQGTAAQPYLFCTQLQPNT